MTKIKEALLRELGDDGADTLRRYYAQIEYTAYWCIKMLHDYNDIVAVFPEAVEDVVIVRRNVSELHQIKTRNESRGPWTFAELLPIICQQYHRRKAFSNCKFYFVSNQIGEKKEQKDYGGSLYRLKTLLEIKHSGQDYSEKEKNEMSTFEDILAPKIQEMMLDRHGESIDKIAVIELLHSTHIETECSTVYHSKLVEVLDNALDSLFPGQPAYTMFQLNDICKNIIMLVIKRIIGTITIDERRICREDVLNCRSSAVNIFGFSYLDLNTLPGKTTLDKKLLYGGFHITELPRFHRQKVSAEYFRRSYTEIGMNKNVDELIDALLESQGECRDAICRVNGVDKKPGPRILSMLKPLLENIIKSRSFPGQDLTSLVCLGLIWSETHNCNAYWHSLEDLA